MGDFQGVNEVGFSREANLSLVNLGGEDVGFLEEIEVSLGVISGDLFQYVVKPDHTFISIISPIY